MFAMSGLSKIAGLPQMKLGWIVASGPVHAAALDGLEWICRHVPVGRDASAAGVGWSAGGDGHGARTNPRADREEFGAGARDSRWQFEVYHHLRAEGGWYIVIQVPGTRSEEAWALGLLRDRNVLVQPGFFYDFESEAYLIVSLLTETTVLCEDSARYIESVCRRTLKLVGRSTDIMR